MNLLAAADCAILAVIHMSARRDDVPSPYREQEPWHVPLVEFGTHIIVGTGIFLLIAAAAWVLHLATSSFHDSAPILYYVLRAVEIIVFAGDIALYLIFVARTIWRSGRRLMKGWNS